MSGIYQVYVWRDTAVRTYSKFLHMSGIYLEYTSMPKARISLVSMHVSILLQLQCWNHCSRLYLTYDWFGVEYVGHMCNFHLMLLNSQKSNETTAHIRPCMPKTHPKHVDWHQCRQIIFHWSSGYDRHMTGIYMSCVCISLSSTLGGLPGPGRSLQLHPCTVTSCRSSLF
jgi:hypothetical protein